MNGLGGGGKGLLTESDSECCMEGAGLYGMNKIKKDGNFSESI